MIPTPVRCGTISFKDALGNNIVAEPSCNVAFWTREIGYKTRSHGVWCRKHHDSSSRRFLK